jgi:hypothetical protein
MKRYLRVTWRHDSLDQPTVLVSEIDAGVEMRKVEVCRDGRMDYADRLVATASTQLSETLMPSVEEIAAQAEFTPEEIDEATFERIWQEATRKGDS